MGLPKYEYKCEWCGKTIMRPKINPNGTEIKHHFCNTQCKGAWQKKQREDLGYTKEWLYEEYIVKKRTMNDIAKEIGRDPKRVWEWAKDYGIETRGRGYGNPECHFKKGHKLRVGCKLSEEHKEKLRQLRLRDGHVPYLKNGRHWLKQNGVHSPAWKGGVTPERQSLYYSEEWKDAVKEVWKRDNATCQLCGKSQNDNRNCKFHIHHLYSFADYKHIRSNPDNLVLLCRECHLFVHSKKNVEKIFVLKEARLPEWLEGEKNGQ